MPDPLESDCSDSPFWWRVLITWIGLEAVAAALWLTPASVHIVNWPAVGPHRVALLAPLAHLVYLTVGAAAGVVLLSMAGRSTGAMRSVSAATAPLSLFWLWVVPYLPWIPDRLPLLLALAGPLRWLVATVAGLFVLRAVQPLAALTGLVRVSAGRRAVFFASLVLYVGLGTLSARSVGPGGDEPHYLVIAHSLMADGDLRIENNHQRGDYRSFFGGDMPPHFLQRGQDGEIYSIHAPGLPVILLPAYALGGHLGSVVLMALLAALAALAMFDLAERIVGRGAAWLTWAAVCVTVPFIPHSWLLFPEMPAALIVAAGARWLWLPPSPVLGRWVARGALLGVLPWLHTKFVVLLAVLAAALVLRLRRRPRALVALIGMIAVSLAAWLYFFYLIYGVPDPQAPYGLAASTDLQIANIPRGLLGLLFDQKFGLLFYSPVYLVAAVGCWRMLRSTDTRALGWALLVTAAAFVGSATRYYMWWGGSSAPARFLVPILPCAAPMVAVGVASLRAAAPRALMVVCLSLSVGVALIGAAWPSRLLLFSPPHGRAQVLEWLQAGSPLVSAWPTFTEGEWVRPFVQLLPWALAGVITVVATTAVARWRLRMTSAGLGATGALVFFAVAAVVTAFPAAAARGDTARSGASALMWKYDGDRLRGFDFATLETITPDQVVTLSTVSFDGLPAPGVTLPPGSYEARVWLAGNIGREGEVVVRSASHSDIGRVQGSLRSPVVVPFDLLVAVRQVTVTLTEGRPEGVQRVEFVPLRIVPASGRDNRPARAVEAIDGWPGGQIVYVDDGTYPEGGVFWTRGTDVATVLVAPAGASRVVLTLFLGPMSGDVRATIGGVEHVIRVNADEPMTYEAAVPSGLPLVPLTIKAPAAFRPVEVDPESTDTRWLGCQVRVDLR